MSLSRFSFKLPDLSAFGKRLIRSAQDIKSKAMTFFKPRKPVDVSIKAKEELEVQRIKEAQALKVKEGKATAEAAQKENLNTLLQQPNFVTRLKNFFEQRFNFFVRKPDPDIIKADVNAKIETVKAEAEVKAKEVAAKEKQDYIDANKPNVEAAKAELTSTVQNWKDNFLNRLTKVRERIDPDIELKNRVNTAKSDAEKAELETKRTEAEASKTRAEATKAETRARDAEQKVKEIKEKGGTEEDIQKVRDDAKKARDDAKKAKAEAEKADAEARKARQSSDTAKEKADTAKEKADKAQEKADAIREKGERAEREKMERLEGEANKAKGEAEKAKNEAETAKNKAEEADAAAKKAKSDAEEADAKVKEAEAKEKELRDKGASKEELEKAEADTKKAKEDAKKANDDVKKTEAEANKAKQKASKANEKANKANEDANKIREKFEKEKIEKAESDVKKAREDAEAAKKKAEEADAEAKKAKEDADDLEAKAKKAEEDLENIRKKDGATKEEIEKAEANAKKAREDAETAKKKAEEADAKAKKAKEDADAAQKKVTKAEEDLNNIRNKNDPDRLDADTPKKLKEDLKDTKNTFKEIWKKTEKFRENVKIFTKKIMGVLFMIAVIILPILLAIFVIPPFNLPPIKPPNFINPFNTFSAQPLDIWNLGGPGGPIGGPDGGPTGGPPGGPPNVPLPALINPSPERGIDFNFQGTITFTLANIPDEDIIFQLKPTYDNLKFDDDIITFYVNKWDTPVQTNYYCNIDTTILNNSAFKNLNTKSKKQYLQKETYVDEYSLQNPTTEEIINQKKRLEYLLKPIETLGETLERLEYERKYDEKFQGGEYIEPLYDEDQYKSYEPIVDPTIRNADIVSAKQSEQSDTVLEEVVEPIYEDGYDNYQGYVIPTQEEQEGGQEEEYNNIDDIDYDNIAQEVEIDDLDNDYKCRFEIILAQETNYVVGVNIELDDETLILDPNYLEMNGTNQVGSTYITSSQLMNMYQQIYVSNAANELDMQVNEIASQQYYDGIDAINQQEQAIDLNGDMIYQNAYENSLDKDNETIDNGEFILNALNFDEMLGGSYFLNKFKKTNKRVN